MKKQIHFYESKKVIPEKCNILHDWESMNEAIDNKQEIIHTTQMCMLKASFIYHDGYRLFVHQGNGIMYEVRLKERGRPDNQWTIRPSQNAYAMWAANVFRVEMGEQNG